jgi:hypothetical protein
MHIGIPEGEKRKLRKKLLEETMVELGTNGSCL